MSNTYLEYRAPNSGTVEFHYPKVTVTQTPVYSKSGDAGTKLVATRRHFTINGASMRRLYQNILIATSL